MTTGLVDQYDNAISTGIRRDIRDECGELRVVATADVEANLDFNKACQNDGDNYTKSRDMRHVASIPPIFLEVWLNEEWARGNTQLRLFTREWQALVRKKLNDPDWRFLRTGLGTI